MRDRVGAAARWTATAAALLAVGCEAAPEQYTLELSDEVGQTSRYQIVNEVKTRATVEGLPESQAALARSFIENDTRVELYVTETLVAVDTAGVRTYETRLDSLDVSGTAGGEPVEMPAMEPTGTPIRTRVSARGEVLSVESDDARLAAVAESFQLATAAPRLPGRPVRVGEAWAYELSWPIPNLGTSVRTSLESRLKEVTPMDPALAVIEVRGTFSADTAAPSIGAPPMTPGGTISGTIVFDLSTGRVAHGEYAYQMTLDVEAQRGIRLKTVADGTSKMEHLGTR